MMKRLIALILVSLFLGERLYHLREGFSRRRIFPITQPVVESWSADTEKLLSQPFHYLGRGRQCFAFASLDGKYVLKIIRTDIYQTPFWARLLPAGSYRKKIEAEHKTRKQAILDSFALSFNELKEETALIAIHVGTSGSKEKILTLIDRLGVKYTLPLATTPFLLQHKKPMLMEAFETALKNGDFEKGEKILSSLLSVIAQRAEKGILNRDPSFLRNYGYEDEKAYQIDLGSFYKDPNLKKESAYKKSILSSVKKIEQWLNDHAPQMLPLLHDHLRDLLDKEPPSCYN